MQIALDRSRSPPRVPATRIVIIGGDGFSGGKSPCGRESGPEHVAALDRVRAWTRERFTLAADAAILVSEVSCALPGCPPRETVVAFWTEDEQRHQFKLFKPVTEVVVDDLPPRWLKDALAAIEGLGCECC